jgi:hypothetical protein
LLVAHLESPNFTPPALPERIWGSNAAIWQALTRPRDIRLCHSMPE